MKQPTPAKTVPGKELAAKVFAVVFGAFMGLTLIKFSNVAIFESLVLWPENGWEWALNPWPVAIGYGLLAALAVAGIAVAGWELRGPRWLALMPLAWLAWQLVSATHTVDAALTSATLKHFVACVVCFYLGYFTLRRRESPLAFLAGLIVALALVMVVGFEQHFGGLEQTRRYFFTYLYPQMAAVPPEYLKKISSNRIWGTLFYPNALAGALLLLLPVTLTVILKHFTRLTLGARQFVAGVFAVGGLACLFWSGSKGGWLLMLLLGLVALLHVPFARRLKLLLIGVLLLGGLAGFGLKYAGFFQRGATSVSARFDYWQAAGRTALANPVLGTGPGTFAIPYLKIKRPESEMAKLVHNDYLQQASDSGLVGLITFGAFVIGGLCYSRPHSKDLHPAAVPLAVWLGLVGWWLQGLLEFGLYIPALAWTGFALTGWLLASEGKRIDKPVAKA